MSSAPVQKSKRACAERRPVLNESFLTSKRIGQRLMPRPYLVGIFAFSLSSISLDFLAASSFSLSMASFSFIAPLDLV